MDNNFLGTVLAALIGALAGVVGAFLSSRQSRELERQRWQQELSLAKQSSDQALQLEQHKHGQELELERLRLTQELRVEYDKDVRQHRIDAYKPLWQITGRFPQYARSEPVTYAITQQFSVDLREWYFETGGIYLTKGSLAAYLAVQELVKQRLESRQSGVAPDTELAPDDYDTVRSACSALRSQLLADVGTRKESELNNKEAP